MGMYYPGGRVGRCRRSYPFRNRRQHFGGNDRGRWGQSCSNAGTGYSSVNKVLLIFVVRLVNLILNYPYPTFGVFVRAL